MKLIKFRIEDYKSITDSGNCWLSSDMTVLAGKNESGKSAILEALRDFDTSVKEIPDSAIPLDGEDAPVVKMFFEIEKSFFDELSKKIDVTFDKEFREYVTKEGLQLLKYVDGSYDFGNHGFEKIDGDASQANQQHLDQLMQILGELKKVEQLSSIADPKIDDELEQVKQSISATVAQAEGLLPNIPDETVKQQTAEKIAVIKKEFNALQKTPKSKMLDEIILQLPELIFFSDFEGFLPFEIPLSESLDNEAVKDFAKVAGIDLGKVTSTKDTQRRKNLLKDHSATLSADFMGYWKQDEIKLIADTNGENLIIGVEESGKSHVFKVEQRSKGLQWFLTFYLRLRARETDTNIILIDEPGLYLHAKAQNDVLKVLEKIAKKSQIIFSTHSPYLIDPNRLDRVRLILKDSHGTKIENKIHKNADNETLTPIITAIGLDLTNQFSIAGKKNVILEGISDYYYLGGAKQYLPKTTKGSDLNLIPCVGAPKIPQIASLLIGWGLEFAAMLDNDTEGKRIAKELGEKLLVQNERIIHVSNQDNYSIEDLFSHDDFNDYILDNEKNNDISTSNSKFIKDQKLDKVLLAKRFIEKIEREKTKITFSEETKKNFQDIFEKLSKLF